MGKEVKKGFYTQLSNNNIYQKIQSDTKTDSNQENYLGTLPNEMPYFIPKKLRHLEKSNFQKNNNKSSKNKLYEKESQNNNNCPNTENKNSRKYSSGTDTSCTSTECSPKKNNNTKKSFYKENKNKIPFKGDAKDFKIKYKTELCKYYEINGYCKYGDKCAYAHGKENLRSKVTNTTAYRTKKCAQFFEQGYCPYGNRCQFAHQLKSNIINNPYDRGMTYGKILETISKLENVENIKKLIEKPRLPIFKEICDNKKNTPSRLLEDIKGLSYNNLYKRTDN
jgi:hypothetical protein